MKRIMLLILAGMLTMSLMSCAGSQAFQRGERYAQRGEWDLAVKEYRDANRREPNDIEYRSALIRAEETAANQRYKKARAFLKERKLDQAITELQQEVAHLEPEAINEGPHTAPSKRIIHHLPIYERTKVRVGAPAAAAIGLPVLRGKCPHFAQWLANLEKLA